MKPNHLFLPSSKVMPMMLIWALHHENGWSVLTRCQALSLNSLPDSLQQLRSRCNSERETYRQFYNVHTFSSHIPCVDGYRLPTIQPNHRFVHQLMNKLFERSPAGCLKLGFSVVSSAVRQRHCEGFTKTILFPSWKTKTKTTSLTPLASRWDLLTIYGQWNMSRYYIPTYRPLERPMRFSSFFLFAHQLAE